ARAVGVLFPESRAVQTAHLALRRNGASIPRREQTRRALRALDEREMKAVCVDERQTAIAEPGLDRADLHAVLLEPGAPVVEASCWYFQARFHCEAVPEAWFIARGGPGKKRQVRAGAAFGVRVEQVVGPGIVLVDRSLHQVHAQDAGVEIHVLLRRTRDR